VPSHERRADRARRLARSIRVEIGDEIRNARVGAGISQRAADAASGMSHAQFGRIERGVLETVTVNQLARACVPVGLRLSVRAYPAGPPIRDAAHLDLLRRLGERVPAAITWRSELPLPYAGDGRAWDAVVTLEGVDVAIEAETRLHDLQALDRRIALKRRDGAIERVVLLVNDTATNRRVLRAVRDDLRPAFPADGREILDSLRRGRLPGRGGVVLL
jgi:transcriptional regulator with XRE-family HTH domain